jgi:hypothetical protein
MYAEFTVKLKALALAVMINALLIGSAAFLFDGQIHADHRTHPGVSSVYASLFRP